MIKDPRPASAPPRRDAPSRELPPVRPAASRPGRGRTADAVALAKRLWGEIGRDDVPGQSAKLAYYAFLSMPPALMALFGLAGLLGNERLAAWLEGQAALALPAAVMESILRPFIHDVVLNEAPGPFSLGLVLALWGGSSVFAGLIDALNKAYGIGESRSWVRKRALSLATMLGSVLLFLSAAAALLAGPALAKAVRLGGVVERLWSVAQWPLAFGFMVAAFWIGYYVLPNRDQRPCKWILLKVAAFAAALWVAATAAFRLYVAHFSSYSDTYGFLGAFIILLLWLYMTAMVVLVGGELAAELEGRR